MVESNDVADNADEYYSDDDTMSATDDDMANPYNVDYVSDDTDDDMDEEDANMDEEDTDMDEEDDEIY